MKVSDWILQNANAISGYVILLVVVIVFVWALGSGRLYMGRNIDTILAGKQADLDRCLADLAACRKVVP